MNFRKYIMFTLLLIFCTSCSVSYSLENINPKLILPISVPDDEIIIDSTFSLDEKKVLVLSQENSDSFKHYLYYFDIETGKEERKITVGESYSLHALDIKLSNTNRYLVKRKRYETQSNLSNFYIELYKLPEYELIGVVPAKLQLSIL
ncbi:MAG: hypothetical protein MJA82_15650 [Clostridia bacterium]|nr:hypothetical protein [Clostridia bacterium]